MKLTVSFFDRGPSCPTDRAPSPFFGFVLFVLFIFYFWFVFFSLVPDCTTTQRKLSPAVKYPFFRCPDYLFWGSDCVFPVLPLHPLRTSRAGFDGSRSSSTTISSQRWRHKRSPSSDPLLAEVFMIIFGNTTGTIFTNSPMISFDHPTLSGPRQGLSVDSLFLISFMLRKRRRSRGGGRRKKKKTETASIGHAGCRPRWLSATLASESSTRVPVLHHSNALS